jgi:hypothetical protein
VAAPAEKVWQIGPRYRTTGREGGCVGFAGRIKMSRRTLSYLVSQGYVSACAAAQIPRR